MREKNCHGRLLPCGGPVDAPGRRCAFPLPFVRRLPAAGARRRPPRTRYAAADPDRGLNLAITFTANMAGLTLAWVLQSQGGVDAGIGAFVLGSILAIAVGALSGLIMGFVIAYTRPTRSWSRCR